MKITILGAGTWGVALARMLCQSGHDVTLWARNAKKLAEMRRTRRQPNLPGVELPPALSYESNAEAACAGAEMLVMAVASVAVRETARRMAPFVRDGQLIVDVAKGMEPGTLLTLSQVISQEIKNAPVVTLSGPTHAEEVARDLPSTIVAAHADMKMAQRVQQAFSTPAMRVYTNTDQRGVELCGALKNIIALAAGIASGLGFGDNTRAALITRGLAEMTRLGLAMGCLQETFAGLAGMGDLIVTATSHHSRNNRCGFFIGQGCPVADAVQQIGMVVEGINALPAAMALAKQYDVELPIVFAVDQVVHHGVSPLQAVQALMGRTSTTELRR